MGGSHKCMHSYCTPEYSLQSFPHKKLLEVVFKFSHRTHKVETTEGSSSEDI